MSALLLGYCIFAVRFKSVSEHVNEIVQPIDITDAYEQENPDKICIRK